MSRAGGAAESEQLPPVYIPLTFYPGVGYLCVFGVNGDGFFFSSAIKKRQNGYERSEFPFCCTGAK
jgi:hypothetical protein